MMNTRLLRAGSLTDETMTVIPAAAPFDVEQTSSCTFATHCPSGDGVGVEPERSQTSSAACIAAGERARTSSVIRAWRTGSILPARPEMGFRVGDQRPEHRHLAQGVKVIVDGNPVEQGLRWRLQHARQLL